MYVNSRFEKSPHLSILLLVGLTQMNVKIFSVKVHPIPR